MQTKSVKKNPEKQANTKQRPLPCTQSFFFLFTTLSAPSSPPFFLFPTPAPLPSFPFPTTLSPPPPLPPHIYLHTYTTPGGTPPSEIISYIRPLNYPISHKPNAPNCLRSFHLTFSLSASPSLRPAPSDASIQLSASVLSIFSSVSFSVLLLRLRSYRAARINTSSAASFWYSVRPVITARPLATAAIHTYAGIYYTKLTNSPRYILLLRLVNTSSSSFLTSSSTTLVASDLSPPSSGVGSPAARHTAANTFAAVMRAARSAARLAWQRALCSGRVRQA